MIVCRRRNLALVLLMLLLAFGVNGKERPPSLRAIFSEADFIPNIPTIADVKRRFPKSVLITSEGQKLFVTRASANRWLVFHFDDELPDRYSGVSEVELINWSPDPLASKLKPDERSVPVTALAEFKMGDPVGKLSASHRNFRIKQIKKYGVAVQVYEFNPRPSEPDLYARLLIKSGVVIGFSLGVTE